MDLCGRGPSWREDDRVRIVVQGFVQEETGKGRGREGRESRLVTTLAVSLCVCVS